MSLGSGSATFILHSVALARQLNHALINGFNSWAIKMGMAFILPLRLILEEKLKLSKICSIVCDQNGE